MINDLIGRVFATRNAAHLAHWATKSYAQHVALGDFYDGVIDKIDAIVEAYQGIFKLVRGVKFESGDDGADILARIGRDADWIEKNRSDIAEGDAALLNMIDDLTQLYATTYYKLKNLS